MNGDPDRPLSTKERADLYLALADRSTQRFDAIRTTTWKANLGMWTFFVAGTAVVLNLGYVNARGWLILFVLLASVLTFFLAFAYSFVWLRYVHEVHQRTGQCSFWWECMARICTDEAAEGAERLPPEFDAPPGVDRPSGLESTISEEDYWPNIWPRTWTKPAAKKMKIHEAHLVWFFITWALWLLFVCAMIAKAAEAPAPTTPSSGPTVTSAQLKLEVDAELRPTDQQGR